jgi:hypothetical protein
MWLVCLLTGYFKVSFIRHLVSVDTTCGLSRLTLTLKLPFDRRLGSSQYTMNLGYHLVGTFGLRLSVSLRLSFGGVLMRSDSPRSDPVAKVTLG